MEEKQAVATLAMLAEYIGAELDGPADKPISGIATLQTASPEQLSFFSNARYRKTLLETQAGAVILQQADRKDCPSAALIMSNPYLGYARAASLLHPPKQPTATIHPTAWVHEHAHLGENVSVGPQAVIDAHAHVGDNSIIGPGCVIESGVILGEACRLEANVTLCSGCRLGQRVHIHPGAVIGADGFGNANDRGRWIKVPQLGGVRIEDDVEIGANTTVDKGALEDTVIEEGARLDNQIQIAHNVHIGAHTAVAGCVGIAGSTKIGKYCMIAGGVGIVGHIEIVDNVQITGGSIVLQSIREPGLYSSGVPLQSNRQWHKNYYRFKQLDEFSRRLRNLEADSHE